MRQAQRHAARDDGHLVQRIGVRSQRGHQRVSGFVIRGVLLLFVADDQALALDAHHHFVFGEFEIELRDDFAILARGDQRGFVHQVRQIGSGESRSAAGDGRSD